MSIKLNKADLVNHVAATEGMSKNAAGDLIDKVLLGIINTLESVKGEQPDNNGEIAKLVLVGFGTFKLRHVPEREHVNPQNREQKTIKPAHNEVKFKSGKTFDDYAN